MLGLDIGPPPPEDGPATGSLALLPGPYRGWLRRDRTPGPVRLEQPRNDTDWAAVAQRVADERNADPAAHLQDSGHLLLQTVLAIAGSGGPAPGLADRTAAGPGAAVLYQGSRLLRLEAHHLPDGTSAKRLQATLRPMLFDPVQVLVSVMALSTRALQLLAAMSSRLAGAQAGESVALDERELNLLGCPPPHGVTGDIELTCLGRADRTSEHVQLLARAKQPA